MHQLEELASNFLLLQTNEFIKLEGYLKVIDARNDLISNFYAEFLSFKKDLVTLNHQKQILELF